MIQSTKHKSSNESIYKIYKKLKQRGQERVAITFAKSNREKTHLNWHQKNWVTNDIFVDYILYDGKINERSYDT